MLTIFGNNLTELQSELNSNYKLFNNLLPNIYCENKFINDLHLLFLEKGINIKKTIINFEKYYSPLTSKKDGESLEVIIRGADNKQLLKLNRQLHYDPSKGMAKGVLKKDYIELDETIKGNGLGSRIYLLEDQNLTQKKSYLPIPENISLLAIHFGVLRHYDKLSVKKTEEITRYDKITIDTNTSRPYREINGEILYFDVNGRMSYEEKNKLVPAGVLINLKLTG